MKIFSIKLQNFRQYRGENVIEFSASDKKNITVVEGTTGAGKTTILNAMHWCLYGREPVFEGLESGVAPICNRAELSQAKGTTDVSVELALGETAPTYFFKRSVRVWNTEKEEPSHEVIVKPLQMENSDRTTNVFLNTNLVATATFEASVNERDGRKFTERPDYLVDKILPRDLAFVFLFNGEELKTFFGAHSNLQKALEDISQITLVIRAVEQLGKVTADFRRQASRESADTQRMSQELDELNGILERKRDDKKAKDIKIDSLARKIEDADNTLRSLDIERVNGLLERRKTNTMRRDQLITQLKEMNEERNVLLLSLAPVVFLEDQIGISLRKIDELGERGKLPPPIRQIFLQDLLDKGLCICGRSIKEHEEGAEKAREHIKKLMENQGTEEAISYIALPGRYILQGMANSIQGGVKKLSELGRKMTDADHEVEEIDARLETISNDLRGFEAGGMTTEELKERVRSVESVRDELRSTMETLIGQRGGDQRDIENLENDVKEKGKEIRDELKKKAKNESATIKLALCESSLEMLDTIKEGMITEVRDEIQRKTDSHFRELIWKTAKIETESGNRPVVDLQNLQKVVINSETNEINVITKNGENWVRSLSQGETQTLAYSFIAALKEGAKVAFPMVVDTPLGIIDEGPPRELFAGLLPEFVKDTQLIFLMTSAEYTPKVQKILTTKVGAMYRLKFDYASGGTSVTKLG